MVQVFLPHPMRGKAIPQQKEIPVSPPPPVCEVYATPRFDSPNNSGKRKSHSVPAKQPEYSAVHPGWVYCTVLGQLVSRQKCTVLVSTVHFGHSVLYTSATQGQESQTYPATSSQLYTRTVQCCTALHIVPGQPHESSPSLNNNLSTVTVW